MKKVAAERYRDIDFSRARRGPVVKPEPGKTKISIRLDNTVLEYFRSLVDNAGEETTKPLSTRLCLSMCIAVRHSMSFARRSGRRSLPTESPFRPRHPCEPVGPVAD